MRYRQPDVNNSLGGTAVQKDSITFAENRLSPSILILAGVTNSVDTILSSRPSEYVYYGSSLLEAMNIRKANDTDILVTPALYDSLLRVYEAESEVVSPDMFTIDVGGKKYDVMRRWLDWNRDEAINIIRSGQQINGKNFAVLADVLKYKHYLEREKDKRDIEAILEYVRSRSSTGPRKRAQIDGTKIYA